MSVSLFASAVRPKIWEPLFQSLQNTTVNYEIVFSGNCLPLEIPIKSNEDFIDVIDFKNINEKKTVKNIWKNLKYIHTNNIKPAQCYEIARRNCSMETVVWIADDCEFPDNVIGKAYDYWKSKNNEKLILSIQTKESGYNLPQGALFDMRLHSFIGGDYTTPLMAPLGMMSRKYLDELGGIDRRYVCGQYENDIVMRAYQDGGSVEIFGNKDCFIDIDHLGKSFLMGESNTEADFLNRPFAKGYRQDRLVLEQSWLVKRSPFIGESVVSKTRLDTFMPYEDIDLLTKSQSNKGHWE